MNVWFRSSESLLSASTIRSISFSRLIKRKRTIAVIGYDDEDLRIFILLRRFDFAGCHVLCIEHQTWRIFPIHSSNSWRYRIAHSEGARHQQCSLIITINRLVLLFSTGMCWISSLEKSCRFQLNDGSFLVKPVIRNNLEHCVDTLRSIYNPME